MSGSNTGRFAIGGRRGSAELRFQQRRAIMDAHIEMVIGAAIAQCESGWLGPEHSPLGSVGHVQAVERRIARRKAAGAGPVDAAIIAGRHMLSLDAMVDEYFTPASSRLTERVLSALARRPARNDNARRGAR